MTIPEQVDAYRALLDEKDRLAEETKANNRAIEAARDALEIGRASCRERV